MGKHLFIKMFQLINEKEMIEYSPTHNKSMDLGIEYQFQLTSQKREPDILCPLLKEYTMIYGLAKRLNLSLLRSLDPCVNIQRIEEHAELCHEYAINKI